VARRRSRHRLPAALAVTGAVVAAALHTSAGRAAAGHASRAGAAAWPLPGPGWSQFRRVDEGVDLQYPGTRPVPVYAAAAGRVVILGPDPHGFGDAYPGLVLDHPVTVHGRTFTEIYYGHAFPDRAVTGHHVSTGEVIGYTGGAHSGGDAYRDSNWLEIGFFPPSFPNGPLMRQWLPVRAGRP
jgi:hypothetical protein